MTNNPHRRRHATADLLTLPYRRRPTLDYTHQRPTVDRTSTLPDLRSPVHTADCHAFDPAQLAARPGTWRCPASTHKDRRRTAGRLLRSVGSNTAEYGWPTLLRSFRFWPTLVPRSAKNGSGIPAAATAGIAAGVVLFFPPPLRYGRKNKTPAARNHGRSGLPLGGSTPRVPALAAWATMTVAASTVPTPSLCRNGRGRLFMST